MVFSQHRSYRTLVRKGFPFWIDMIILSSISLVSLYAYGTIFYNDVVTFLHQIFLQSGMDVEMIGLKIYTFDMLAFDVPFLYTQPMLLFIALVGIVTVMIVLFYQRVIPLNVVFWIEFLLVLMGIFILYFIFFSRYFPYSAEKYFNLYLYAYVGFMLMCFLVLSFSLALTPESFGKKLSVLLMVIAYYFIYSFVRFAMTVLLVSQVSVVFAPLMYFTIFYDFILIIYVYTFMLYKETQKNIKGSL